MHGTSFRQTIFIQIKKTNHISHCLLYTSDFETSCPLIFDNYLKPESIAMFEATGVMTRKELEARNEVKWEMSTKQIQIEARVLGDLAMNHIIPVATEYQSTLIDNVYTMCIRDRDRGISITAHTIPTIPSRHR